MSTLWVCGQSEPVTSLTSFPGPHSDFWSPLKERTWIPEHISAAVIGLKWGREGGYSVRTSQTGEALMQTICCHTQHLAERKPLWSGVWSDTPDNDNIRGFYVTTVIIETFFWLLLNAVPLVYLQLKVLVCNEAHMDPSQLRNIFKRSFFFLQILVCLWVYYWILLCNLWPSKWEHAIGQQWAT